MFYTVYILYSEKHKKHYTGFTADIAERLKSHNELGKDWTSGYRPPSIRKHYIDRQQTGIHVYCKNHIRKNGAKSPELYL